jgi:hypothetical protein
MTGKAGLGPGNRSIKQPPPLLRQRDNKYKITHTHTYPGLSERGEGLPVKRMRRAGIDECLVRWTDSFMRDRRVIMSVDGQDGEPMDVTTGLPQGSPISLALFAIYIADIHEAVEDQVEDSRGISYVDDVTWVVEGVDADDVVSRLERCARASLDWANGNAVRFEESKTEAILFSNRRRHRLC